jgi:hypothetical protein
MVHQPKAVWPAGAATFAHVLVVASDLGKSNNGLQIFHLQKF